MVTMGTGRFATALNLTPDLSHSAEQSALDLASALFIDILTVHAPRMSEALGVRQLPHRSRIHEVRWSSTRSDLGLYGHRRQVR
jgi:hypothetical protein